MRLCSRTSRCRRWSVRFLKWLSCLHLCISFSPLTNSPAMLGFFFSRALCLSFLVLLPFSELRCCSGSNCIFASHLFEIALFALCYFFPLSPHTYVIGHQQKAVEVTGTYRSLLRPLVQGYLKPLVPDVQRSNGLLTDIHDAVLISVANWLCKPKLA